MSPQVDANFHEALDIGDHSWIKRSAIELSDALTRDLVEVSKGDASLGPA
jgi:hypothetical protein